MVRIKLPDGSVKEYPEGVRPREVAEGIGKRLADAAVAAVANGTVVDLDRPLEDGTGDAVELRLLTPRDREALDVLRHSTAHIMARAILRLFPGARLAFGPTTATGFYYDVDLPDRPLSEDDFPAIEAEMAAILKEAEPFERFSLPVAEARQFVDDLGQGYKVEHIDDELHKYGVLSFYRQGEFVDLCRGPHIPHAGKVGAFKLLSIAGAYWKGHTDRKMLQRVYGTAFFDKKELDAHLAQVEEAKKRDHRRIGKELNLFTISPLVGSGLILWMPKGAIVRGVLENFLKDELLKRGYQPVYTPHIGKIELYKTSGHYPYYKDSQFPPLRLSERPGDGTRRRPGEGDARRPGAEGPPGRGPDRPGGLLGPRPRRSRRLRRGARRERGIPPQADELPAPHPDLRRPAEELPRPPRAPGRVRHGLSLRAVGRAVGPDPGPRVHAGRRPPLLHRGAGPRRVPGDDGADPVRAQQPGADRLPAPALEARPGRPEVRRGRWARPG